MSLTIRPEGPRQFTLMTHDGGIVLCDKWSGAVLCISYPEELQQIRELLNAVATWQPASKDTAR
jgi:hypothetical protein